MYTPMAVEKLCTHLKAARETRVGLSEYVSIKADRDGAEICRCVPTVPADPLVA